MATSLTEQVRNALVQFSSTTRLYEITVGDRDIGLLVEAFVAEDAVNTVAVRDVIALSTSIHVTLDALLGQPATLEVSLADRTRTSFAGDIEQVAALGSDGGFARYRLRISSWLWRLGHVRNSRVWQDKSVIEIVDAVFNAFRPQAQWRWSDETPRFIADAVPRSYCCQYRESDLDFVCRLLAEEGLSWRFEHTATGPCMVLFADSTMPSAVPEDRSSALDGGIRYHAASAVERQDTVQALVAQRRLHAALTTLLSHDYKSMQAKVASSPSYVKSGRTLPVLESYDVPGQYAYADHGQARRYANLRMEAEEARIQMWRGRSTVRTLRAGTRMIVTGVPRKELGDAPALTMLRVTSVGVNNLPPPARLALDALFGPVFGLLHESRLGDAQDELTPVIEQAIRSGYANCFEAIPANLPWRPRPLDNDGQCRPKPTAFGTQSAIVIGPDGNAHPRDANELYCDRLGRVRIRFHWQDNANASCWVRVAQRSAGGGMGSQFLPRIGQEVLVQFLENDIDRPIVVGALYNGRGEGGIAPTPGGQVGKTSDASCFEAAHDHACSAQGNLALGHSPVWHGASANSAGHRNPAAQWGVRSKEFGGAGYNQLLFDDTDAQGRVQLKCTHAATELNLGHLIHAADNYRGSFRGLGAELRTDAYGAVRAGAGLLVSSYRIDHAASSRDPVGTNTPAIGMLQQAIQLATALDGAARTHRTVGLASHLGTTKANTSVLDAKHAPLAAMRDSTAGVVDDNDKLPHSRDPIIAIAASEGLGAHAGQNLQLASGETVTVTSGQDAQFVSGGRLRVRAGQALGVLGAAVKASGDGTGFQLIAAKGVADIQAQADELKALAAQQVDVVSVNAHIDWAAAKRISLSTAGGANITIEGGNITVQCPGKMTVRAGKKSLIDPENLNYPIPKLPRSELEPRPLQFKMRLADTPGPHGHALANTPWKIAHGAMPDGLNAIDDDRLVAQGRTDDDGNISLTGSQENDLASAYASNPDRTWLVYPGHVVRLDVRTESPEWNEKQKLLHALTAADFSPDLHASLFDDGASPQTRYAKEAFETLASNSIFPKVKS